MQLQDLAQVVRSKNAGPRRITLDVVFRNDADYQRATQSEALIAEKIAPLYGVAFDAVTVINYPLGRAIKIVVPRQIMSGDPGDRDVYGAQQQPRAPQSSFLMRPGKGASCSDSRSYNGLRKPEPHRP